MYVIDLMSELVQ